MTNDLVPVPFEGTHSDRGDGLLIYWCSRTAIEFVTRDGVNEFTEGHASDTAKFVTWAFPDGSTWVTPERRPAESQPVVSRADVEGWEGSPLTDSEFDRLRAAVPKSTVPEAIGDIVFAITGG